MLNLYIQKLLKVAERDGWEILNLKVIGEPYAVPCTLVQMLNGNGEDITLGFDLNERHWPQQAQDLGVEFKRIRQSNAPIGEGETNVMTTADFPRRDMALKEPEKSYSETGSTIVWCSVIAEISRRAFAINGIPAQKRRRVETVHLGMTLDEEFIQVFPKIPATTEQQ